MIPTRRQNSRTTQRSPFAAVVFGIIVVALTACASTGDAVAGPRVPMECVPFARAVSGVDIRGNAADWWRKAVGRYERARTPDVGSVMVFQRSRRLANGHVAVVSQVISDRLVLLTHANWVPSRVSTDVAAIDVSPNNDWSEVRVWWPPSERMGARTYPTYGFIRPHRPLSTDRISAQAGRIIQTASR
jgi:CHAP domain